MSASTLENLNGNRYAIVLSGGDGTRLWPKSRTLMPKQLQKLNGEESLLQQTVSRILPILLPKNVWTVTSKEYKHEVSEQLKTVQVQLAEHILSEPFGRNTLPAIAWAAAHISLQDPNALVAVFPSDHAIENEKNFIQAWITAEYAANNGYFVMIGVHPTFPATGYGYAQIRNILNQENSAPGSLPIFEVSEFIEKPDYSCAQSFIDQGNYLWNSGIFIFQAQKFMQTLAIYQPHLYEAILHLCNLKCQTAPAEIYEKLQSVSMDYGLLEKIDGIAAVATDLGWSDLGSWEAIYQQREKDEQGNLRVGQVKMLDCHNNLLWSDHGMLATIGLENLAIVQTKDATLICPRYRCQEVKSLVAELKFDHKKLIDSHTTVSRPWGSYSVLDEGPFYKVKRIVVKPGGQLSLQMHYHRSEHWTVIAGTAKVTIGNNEQFLEEGQSVYIPKTRRHRLENPGLLPVEVIEIQTGPYLEEDDIVRYEDKYGRIEASS